MNSLTYAQDSRSYLLHIARYKLKRADVVFFVEQLVPLARDLEQQRTVFLKKTKEDYSAVKAKKFETLIV